MRSTALAAIASLALASPLAPATAAPDPGARGAPDGTVAITAKAAAMGVGYTWGDGVLHYRGRDHHFAVQGVTVADVGFAEITGHGRVYGLHRLSDFTGTYAAATGEATLGRGLGGQYLRNDHGVVLRVDEVTKGARLSGSADGIRLTLGR